MTRVYPFQSTARWLSLGFLAVALLLGGWATTWAQQEQQEEQKEEQQEEQPKIPLTPIGTNPVEMNEIKTRNFPQLKVYKTEQDAKSVKALSPHHAMLQKLAGHWTAQARVVEEPGAEPVESRAAVHSELILGGRALQTGYKSTFMGEAFVGFGLDGYDMDKGHHFSVWMDTTNTGANYASGECTHDGMDVVTLHGEFKDPQTGETIERKTVLTMPSMSRYTYEEWQTRGQGEPMLAMQIVFSKAN